MKIKGLIGRYKQQRVNSQEQLLEYTVLEERDKCYLSKNAYMLIIIAFLLVNQYHPSIYFHMF
jgi:hypothetical protein